MKNKTLAIGSLTVALALVLMSTGAMASGGSKETLDYFNGPLGDASWAAATCEPLVGQVCFTVPSGASSVTITAADASTLPVSFFAAPGGAGCAPLTLSVSPGDVIVVTINGPAFGALDCGTTTGTVGTFTATYS